MASSFLTGINVKGGAYNNNNEENDDRMMKTNNSCFLVKNSENFEKTTSMMVDYLVNEETHFTDMEKIEVYFKEKTKKASKIFNENKDIIQKKRETLKQLQSQISEELVTALKIENQKPKENFEPFLIDLHKAIEIKKHDLKSYQATKDTLYEENFILQKKLNENIKIGDMTNHQFVKYDEIGQNAKKTHNLQKHLLQEVKDFEVTSTLKYDNELNKKKSQCNRLEFEVLSTKKDLLTMQKKLEDMKNLRADKTWQINERKFRNEKYSRDYKEKIREYLRDYIKLQQILRKLKVKDIDSIIRRFKEESVKYVGNNSIFFNLNKDISHLTSIFSNFKKELKIINSKIKESDINITEENIQQMDIKLRYIIERNKSLLQANYEKDEYVKNVFNFICNYEKRFTEMANIITMTNLKGGLISDKKKEENVNVFKNIEENFEILKKNPEWGINECKVILI